MNDTIAEVEFDNQGRIINITIYDQPGKNIIAELQQAFGEDNG